MFAVALGVAERLDEDREVLRACKACPLVEVVELTVLREDDEPEGTSADSSTAASTPVCEKVPRYWLLR